MTRIYHHVATTSYKKTNEHIQYLMKKGWVKRSEKRSNAYEITVHGKDYLGTIEKALSPLMKKRIEELR